MGSYEPGTRIFSFSGIRTACFQKLCESDLQLVTVDVKLILYVAQKIGLATPICKAITVIALQISILCN